MRGVFEFDEWARSLPDPVVEFLRKYQCERVETLMSVRKMLVGSESLRSQLPLFHLELLRTVLDELHAITQKSVSAGGSSSGGVGDEGWVPMRMPFTPPLPANRIKVETDVDGQFGDRKTDSEPNKERRQGRSRSGGNYSTQITSTPLDIEESRKKRKGADPPSQPHTPLHQPDPAPLSLSLRSDIDSQSNVSVGGEELEEEEVETEVPHSGLPPPEDFSIKEEEMDTEGVSPFGGEKNSDVSLQNNTSGNIPDNERPTSSVSMQSGEEGVRRGRKTQRYVEIVVDGERRFQCPSCVYTTGIRSAVYSHFRNRHSEKKDAPTTFTCNICFRKFVDEKLYNNHVAVGHTASTKKFQCKICTKSFNHRSNWVRHLRAIHDAPPPAPTPKPILKNVVYICYECGGQFPEKEAFTAHVEEHKGKMVYPCEVCAKTFSFRSSWAWHLEKFHGKTPTDST